MQKPLSLTIRQLFSTLSVLYILLLFAVLLLTRWLWFYPNELSLYQKQQELQQQSLNAALGILKNQLAEHAANFAGRRAALDFMQNSNVRALVIEEDLFGMHSLDVDAVLVLDSSLELVSAVEKQGKELVDLRHHADLPLLLKRLRSADYFTHSTQQDLLSFKQQGYFFAASPILMQKSAAIAGWVIYLQKMDDELWQALQKITLLHIQPLQDSQTLAAHLGAYCLTSNLGHAVTCLDLSYPNNPVPAFLNARGLGVLLIISIVPLLIFSLLLHQLLAPLQKALALLQQASLKGELSPITLSTRIPIKELRELKNTYNRLVSTSLQQQKHLEQLSYTDRLTDIPNRRAFDFILEKTWHRLNRQHINMALVMVDIDFFKAYNDHYGHQAGDIALYKVAQALASLARRSDELAARVGGEEFALLVHIQNDQELALFQERLHDSIAELHILHEHSAVKKELSVSAGIAWLKPSGSWLQPFSPKDWLEQADKALYQAKHAGRNQAVVTQVCATQPFS